jgi:hypothetical protein
MSCKGLHCPGCGDGGGGWGVLAVIIAVLLIGAAIAKPAEHAAVDVLHFLELAAIVTGCLAAAAAAGGVACLAIRARRRHQNTPRRSPVLPAAPEPARAVTGRTAPQQRLGLAVPLQRPEIPLGEHLDALEVEWRRAHAEGRRSCNPDRSPCRHQAARRVPVPGKVLRRQDPR